jgi:cell division transport system permease protein
VIRALQYSFSEAASSLWRSGRSTLHAMLTIAAGLFDLGFFLIVTTNINRILARWSEAAELSVYLHEDVTPGQLQAIAQRIDGSGLSAGREYVSKTNAADRFRQDFPDLAQTADALEGNPFPASIDVRLQRDARTAGDAVDDLAKGLTGMPGVADVRYDRRLLTRLHGAVSTISAIALVIVLLLAIAAALTVANVVRLAAQARREEIEIMQLVGAPLGYIRGPFVAEGALQGGGGALLALAALWAAFAIGRARFGQGAEIAGGQLVFLPAAIWGVLIAGGVLLGCIGGLIVARSVR